MITGLGHIAITASDMDRSLDFYSRILGLKERFRMHNDDGSLWMVYLLTGAGGFIEIFAGGVDGPEPVRNAVGLKHICLWVDDIDQALADLNTRGLEVDTSAVRTGRSGCRQVFVADPDGVRIELMQLVPGSHQAAALARSGDS